MYESPRMHRYRKNQTMRDLLSETQLNKTDLIMPIFIHEGLTSKKEIESLPGLYQWSLKDVLDEVEDIVEKGIKAIILFGIPKSKDDCGSAAHDASGVIQKAISHIKKNHPDLLVIADCCLCEYTDHGHCGILKNGKLDNDATLKRLQDIAVSYAKAGVDIVATSGMMDGMVSAIRDGLDAADFQMVSIMSYATKYASSLYGPFRDAAGSDDFSGDRKHHQLNPAQRDEALREAEIDEDEGADFLMIKPAMFYLDICREMKENSRLPIVAYQVSGEYAMLKHGAEQGLFDENEVFEESLLSIKRAGASLIVSYYAKEIAGRL